MKKTLITTILIALSSVIYAQIMEIVPKYDETKNYTKVQRSYDREEDGYPRGFSFPTIESDSVRILTMIQPKDYLVLKAEIERLMRLPISAYRTKITHTKAIPVLYMYDIIDDTIDDVADGYVYISYALFDNEKVIGLSMVIFISEDVKLRVFVPFTMQEITKVLAVLK